MKRVEILFVVSVVVFAVFFSAVSLSSAGKVIGRRMAADIGLGGAAGKPRDIDIGAMQRLIRQEYLSDHEAEFYKQVPAFQEGTASEPPQPPPGPQSAF